MRARGGLSVAAGLRPHDRPLCGCRTTTRRGGAAAALARGFVATGRAELVAPSLADVTTECTPRCAAAPPDVSIRSRVGPPGAATVPRADGAATTVAAVVSIRAVGVAESEGTGTGDATGPGAGAGAAAGVGVGVGATVCPGAAAETGTGSGAGAGLGAGAGSDGAATRAGRRVSGSR